MEIFESITTRLRTLNLSRLPLVRQKQHCDCGIACMAMIANYYGKHAHMSSIQSTLETNENGMSVREIIECANQLNLDGRVQKINARQLREISLPAILHWNGNHFVALKTVNFVGAKLHDPAIGKKFASWSEINQRFTGIVIHLKPKENANAIRSPFLNSYNEL